MRKHPDENPHYRVRISSSYLGELQKRRWRLLEDKYTDRKNTQILPWMGELGFPAT